MDINLNWVLAAYNAVLAVIMLVLMQINAQEGGANTFKGWIRRTLYFAVILAFGYRVYALIGSDHEIGPASLLTAMVLGAALTTFAAMRVFWLDRRLPPEGVHYSSRGRRDSHCATCYFRNTATGVCSLVQVRPALKGDCNFVLPQDRVTPVDTATVHRISDDVQYARRHNGAFANPATGH